MLTLTLFHLGLRVLSVRVRELVFEKKSTTYKEVADELIQELINEGKMPCDAKNVPIGINIIEQGRKECSAASL